MKKFLPFVSALVLILSSVLYSFVREEKAAADYEEESLRVQSVMLEHERALGAFIDVMADSLRSATLCDTFALLAEPSAKGVDYSFYLFEGERLVAWHNACLPEEGISSKTFRRPILQMGGNWYYVRKIEVGRYSIVGLVTLFCSYPYNNDYLEDHFHESFGLARGYFISSARMGANVVVKDSGGRFLFSVLGSSGAGDAESLWLYVFLVVMGVAALVMVFSVLHFCTLEPYKPVRQLFLYPLFFFLVLYVVLLRIQLPSSWNDTFLFSYRVFAYDWWMPNLAIVLLFATILILWAIIFYRVFSRPLLLSSQLVRGNNRCAYFFAWVPPLVHFLIINALIGVLVHHSSDLAIYIGDLDVSGASLIKIVILSFLLLSFIFVVERTCVEMASRMSIKALGVVLVVSFGLVFAFGVAFWSLYEALVVACGYVLFLVLFIAINRTAPGPMRFSRFVWVLVLASSFVMVRLTTLNYVKEHEMRELLASNLSYQLLRDDDPIAEQLFKDIDHSMASDTFLIDAITNIEVSESQLFAYLRSHYFSGYFSRYDMQVVACRGDNSTVQLTNTGELYDCVTYFSQLIDNLGSKVPSSSNFTCLREGNGRPCYICRLRSSSGDANLYVQLNLKNTSQDVGYPKLLTNRGDQLDVSQLHGYSYAKYFNGRLARHYGDYDYPTSFSQFDDFSTPFLHSSDGFSHLICPPVQQQLVVLSFPELTLSQVLTDYSYLFLCMLVCSAFVIFSMRWFSGSFLAKMVISERIHASFVAFALILFFVVCVVSAVQGMHRFEDESRSHMSKVLSAMSLSILDELPGVTAQEMAQADYMPLEMDNILHRATDISFADAHVFDVNGALVGTSKRELFMSGLVAPLMNDVALYRLRHGLSDEVFIQESIGTFTFYSIYSPLYGADGSLVAYVNVPYFNDVAAIKRQILSTLVPISNVLMLVILVAIIFSYFLADGITHPLASLRDTLREVDLNKQNVRLSYPDDDEIGQIVASYNRMTEQLALSAEQLAVNERESTWREMARQIAHEIKNPLTPMKLSVQYLVKVYDNKPDAFPAMFRKTSNTLIEQIDQLASVASQFSNVAKMKQYEPVRMDVAARVASITSLFANSENATLAYRGPQNGIFVMADPDLLASVFNNLIKNALQSVAQDEHVDIVVSLSSEANNVVISVADNGKGIPQNVRDNIFRPNFTTKSTGMGLGLAITKTIVTNAGGSITFETEEGRGTTFFVRLPQVL